jgi:hypothetical protein
MTMTAILRPGGRWPVVMKAAEVSGDLLVFAGPGHGPRLPVGADGVVAQAGTLASTPSVASFR